MSKVFMSYRRADSATITGRIHDRLIAAMGEKNIFKDVDDIEPGVDFRQVILDAIDESDVLLVIIGREWIDLRNEHGERRLDEHNDFVRMEVQTGLEKPDLRVIPVLVSGAAMPDASQLPNVLRELAFKNAMVVREDPDFNDDVNILINSIMRILHEKRHGPGRRLALGIAALLLFIIAGIGLFLASQNDAGSGDDGTPVAFIETTDEADAGDFVLVTTEEATEEIADETEAPTDVSEEDNDPTATPVPPTNTPEETAVDVTEATTDEVTATDTTGITEITEEATEAATEEATAEATPDPLETMCIIELKPGFTAVNARSGPTPDFRVVRRISAGEQVQVVARIATNASGFFWWQTVEETWVFNANVDARGACDDIEIVSF